MERSASPSASPAVVGVGGVFIDDIILADGRLRMGTLGGAAVHAMLGAALWGGRPGIAAPVGEGFPAGCRAFLDRHLDTRGLVDLPLPQIRAWQLFEGDGSRRETYRVSETRPFIEGLSPGQLAPQFAVSAAFYLLQGFEGIRRWRGHLTGFVLWEPLQQVMVPGNAGEFRRTLAECAVDAVSPNLSEARAVYGPLGPEALALAMRADGARSVVLRMGHEGSLVLGPGPGGPRRVPAAPFVRLVDATGAGNTYCGGLLAGIAQGMSPEDAALLGAVSASFCLEGWGPVDPWGISAGERDRRLAVVRARVNPR